MVKLFHFSDTHLSHRKFINVRDGWKINNRLTWIEDDFTKGFKESLEIASESKSDFVVHSGDLFDVPVSRNLSTPTEYSRAFLIRELHKFFAKTDNKVPFIIIDGNHGTYLYRNYSTIEFMQAAFPNQVHAATNYDLRKALSENKPLMAEFKDVNFYLFPYFKFGRSANSDRIYDDWIRKNQQPDPNKINIAVAHGIVKGGELHDLLYQYDYDYVALGHEHQQKKVAPNMWQAGSTEKYTFAERTQQKGVLEVSIEKGTIPIVVQKPISRTREMKQIEIKITKNTTAKSLEEEVREKIQSYKSEFDGETAVRIKLKISGNTLMSLWWNMEDALVGLQKEIFSQDYNILEFRWDAQDVQRLSPTSFVKGAKVHEYLIEDPVDDFERYIRNLDLDDKEQAKIFIDRGAQLIKEVFVGASSSSKNQEEEK